jgi:NADH-quinone oxidoreductase subunit J
MDPTTGMLYILCTGAVLSGLGTVLLKHPVHAALSLLASMLALGGAYALFQAHLIAALQIIIYAGAIIIVIVYVIMLLDLRSDGGLWIRLGGLVAVPVLGLFVLLCLKLFLVIPAQAAPALAPDDRSPCAADEVCETSCVDRKDNDGDGLTDCADPDCQSHDRCFGTTKAVGAQLLGPYVLPFEVASVLLLAGIVGSVLLTGRKPQEPGHVPVRPPPSVKLAPVPVRWRPEPEEDD